MKLQAANSSAFPLAASFTLPRAANDVSLPPTSTLICVPTISPSKDRKIRTTSTHLIRNSQGPQTAQGINYSLSNLYELLAKNHISPRRAAVLAYINSRLLRTLPQIDADNAAGTKDPTKLPPNPLTEQSIFPEKVISSNPAPVSDTVNAWDSSNPEPDPKKKPS